MYIEEPKIFKMNRKVQYKLILSDILRTENLMRRIEHAFTLEAPSNFGIHFRNADGWRWTFTLTSHMGNDITILLV